MVQRLESQSSYRPKPYPDLRDEKVVKKLIEEDRIPFIVFTDGQEVFDKATCFIPQGKKEPSQSFKIDISEAKEIAQLRNKLSKQH